MIESPRSFSKITPDWLSQVFGGVIDSFQLEYLEDGIGFMSEVARIHLRSNDENIPESAVMKMPSSKPQRLEMAKSFDSYNREAYFYSYIAPSVPISTPKVYFNGGAGSNFVLVLQDLAHLRRVNQIEGSERLDTLEVMRTLGRLHRKFWGQKLEAMHGYKDDIAYVAHDYPKVLPGSLEILQLRSSVKHWLETFVRNYESVMRAHLKNPCSLIHCDYKLDNLAFSANGVVVYDWGDVGVGPVGYDVAHFLVGSLTSSERQSNEREFVEEYRIELDLAEYTLQQAWNDYLRFIPATFYVAAVLVSLKEKSNRHSQLAITNLKRVARALEDHFVAIRELYSDLPS